MRISMTTTVLVTSLMVGCGGGGNSQQPAAQSADTTTPAVPITPTVPAPNEDPVPATNPESVTLTEQLIASRDFDLTSNKQIDVRIDISGLDTTQGYLSICSEGPEQTPDYDNCFVRTALPDAEFSGALTLSTASKVAYSAIWFLDMSRDPVITRHELAGPEISLVL